MSSGAAQAKSDAPPHEDTQQQQQQQGEQHQRQSGEQSAPNLNPEEVFENFEMPSITALYSDRKPKNITAGLSSGAKNIGRGVLAGVGAFVALPVMGAKTEGVKGAAKGVLMGTGALLGLTVGGVVTGTRQMIRGATNTVEYVKETNDGEKIWDENRREWRAINLDTMSEELPFDDTDLFGKARKAKLEKKAAKKGESPPQDGASTAAPSPPVVGDSPSTTPYGYYALLGVERDAPQGSLKKAFAKKALVLHPDKNVGNPDATKQFQELHDAYKTLSNEVSRAEYDQNGGVVKDNTNEKGGPTAPQQSAEERSPMEDLVGSPQLEPFIGRLRLFIYFNTQLYFSQDLLAEFTDRRVLRCARNLANILDSQGPEFNELKNSTLPDMAQIGMQSTEVMRLVGIQYIRASEEFLEKGVIRTAAKAVLADGKEIVDGVEHTAQTMFRAAKAAYHQNATPDDVLPILLTLSRDEIQTTCKLSAEMALHDLCISYAARETRAMKLNVLGQLFIEAVRNAQPPPPAIQTRPQQTSEQQPESQAPPAATAEQPPAPQ